MRQCDLVSPLQWCGNEWWVRENDQAHTPKDIIATLGKITTTPPALASCVEGDEGVEDQAEKTRNRVPQGDNNGGDKTCGQNLGGVGRPLPIRFLDGEEGGEITPN